MRPNSCPENTRKIPGITYMPKGHGLAQHTTITYQLKHKVY